MKVSIIAIGDELLIGQVVDTNSGALARIMGQHGWEIDFVEVVHDNAADIKAAIDRAFSKTNVVLTTGGLGPTKDDITKRVLLDYFGGEMVRDDSVTENIKEIFRKRGIEMNPLTADQALVPSSCRVIQNRVGTAPIMWFTTKEGKVLVSMPGVPFETIEMFEREVFPQLRDAFPTNEHIGHRTVLLADLTESRVAMDLDEWERNLPPFVHLAYLPKPGLIRLRIDGRHSDADILERTLDRLHDELLSQFAPNVVADEDLLPEDALLRVLRIRGLTLATAESCTGGRIASRITSIAGCSDVMAGGVVAYSNDVKVSILGVDSETLRQHGAVSSETARQMVEGVCRVTGATCAVATTGIAGPSGGSAEKPVGTVWFGIAVDGRVKIFCRHFPGSRERVIDRASTTALTALLLAIKNTE